MVGWRLRKLVEMGVVFGKWGLFSGCDGGVWFHGGSGLKIRIWSCGGGVWGDGGGLYALVVVHSVAQVVCMVVNGELVMLEFRWI